MLAIICALATGASASVATGPFDPPPPAVAKSLQEWQASRFGMFIHWGPVSIKGTEIGWSRGNQVPLEEYDNLYKQFNPTNFDADAWVRTAKDAGMKYIVFTTKHHDGFCMFDTKQTEHNIMRSPFGRDVVKELSAACRRHGLAFGTYYSTCDWHHPDFPRTSPGGKVRRETSNLDRYEQYLRAQVKELIVNYGPLRVLWFDVPQEFDRARGQGVVDYVRSLQPDIIVNNRTGAPGDYDTPEQRVGKYQDSRPWETCMTICHQWAWKPDDKMKTLKECLQTLALCAGGDGNLLFNVGPTPGGIIETRQVERLREMGLWLAKYGQSIYGTRGGPWMPNKTFVSTRAGNSIYLHILKYPEAGITLPAIPRTIRKATVLTGGKASVTQNAQGVSVIVAPALPVTPARGGELLAQPPTKVSLSDEIDILVRLDLDGSAMDIPAVATVAESKIKSTASNVYRNDANHNAAQAFDENPHTRWATDAGTHQAWIAADFGKPTEVAGVCIRQEDRYAQRIKKYEFQYRNGEQWCTIFAGTQIGAKLEKKFPHVTAREFRLNILEATDGPTISEIEFMH